MSTKAQQVVDQLLNEETESPGDLSNKSISELAAMISHDWPQVYFGAVPYLDAMHDLQSVDDKIMHDDGRMTVNYFLVNASKWRGPVAQAVKAELKRRVARR